MQKGVTAQVLSVLALAVSSQLWADDGEMERMVITASAKDQQLSTAPASISVIDADEIKLLPVKDLGDVLRSSVGVSVNTGTGGRNDIYIRGMGQGYVLMLINGKRVSSSNGLWRGGNFDITAIPVDAIARVEVVRGPMSALYGSDAVGGVINVITKQPDENWDLTLDTEYSAMTDGDGGDRTRSNLFGTGKLTDTLGMMFTAEKADQDTWNNDELTPGYDSIEERNTKKLYTAFNWQVADNQTLDLDYQYDNDKVPLTSYSATANREQKIERNTFSLTHKGEWGWGGSELMAYREKSQMYDYNTQYRLQPPLGRNIDETNTIFRGTAFFSALAQDWTVGGEYHKTEVDDIVQYPVTGGDSTEQHSLFIQDQLDFLEQFSLTWGGRYDDNQDYGSRFSPRAYLVFNAENGLVLKGGVGTAFRAPSLFESSPTFASVSCGGACNLTGNPDLDPETSVNYELSAMWSQPRYELSATVYHNRVKDLITVGAWDRVSPTRTYYNEDKVTLQGIELTGSVDLTEDLSLKGNYSYLDTETGTGEELTGRPRQTANLKLDWHVTDALMLYAAGNYYGSHLNSSAERKSGYTLLDLGSSYQFNEHVKFRAGVTNVTNEEPAKDDEDSEIILPGRAVFVGLSLSL
ncbi:TonB-dependent receptor domain-containing protein [Shewanella fodinae]|uniref:TonB-dependent receptor domain-containing protein n=1 Tax=Shewanella fodinae TaxID=552357 RepID=UPI001678070E|nr:TonB-dependent receptor [Shewanella fodinae]MCL2904978.1 TonB-dependent receptor [Shewanella fodinae]GGY89506.1 TonB-dependent receptor [Shewanella fodinae]